MKKTHSTKWKASKQARKQRKYRFNAPLHIVSKFLSAHLSPELREIYKRRNIRLKKHDKIKIMRGSFKGKTGKVALINSKKNTASIEGIEKTKNDGSKAFVPIKISNLMIMEFDSKEDKRFGKNGKESS